MRDDTQEMIQTTEQRGAGIEHAIRILQYNVNKSRNKVLAGLMEDPRRKDFDIIAVQEPWRNTYDHAAYNPRASGFHLIDNKRADSRISIYVNKEISIGSWEEVFHSPDVATVTLRLAGGTQVINVHNVYSPPPASHNDETGTASIIALTNALTMPGRHIVVGDFNLHHPWWCGATYAHQHRIADRLLGIMRDASVELALPRGTITREARRGGITEKTTIDLVWASTELIDQLTHCRIAREMEQSSDHLPISTEIATQDAVATQAPRKRRLWTKMDGEAFDKSLKQGIQEFEQSSLTDRDKIEKVVEGLTQAINKAVDCATPWAQPCEYSKPWWTPECQEAVRLARNRRNFYTRTQSQEAWEEYLRC